MHEDETGNALLNNRDWVVVLGAPSEPDGRPSPVQIRRCSRALEIRREKQNAVFLLMGAAVQNDAVESASMRDWLLSKGVQASSIWTEERTATTRDQVRLLRDLVRRYEMRSLTLISDRTHLPRIRMLMRRAGMDISAVELVGASSIEPFFSKVLRVLYEIGNYVKDWVRGVGQ